MKIFNKVKRIPQSPPTAVPAPFGKGAFWRRTGAFKHPKSPPCQRGEGRRVKPGGGGIPYFKTTQSKKLPRHGRAAPPFQRGALFI